MRDNSQLAYCIIINKKREKEEREHAITPAVQNRTQLRIWTISLARKWPLTYLGDASDHVINVRFERVDSARLLVAAEPDANADIGARSLLGVLLHLLELTSNVGEVFRHLTSNALDSNFPCIHCSLDCVI